MTSSYPPPPMPEWRTVHPRPFLDFAEHPGALKYPNLPSKPRAERFYGPFAVSTHIIPAAYPRMVPQIPLPQIPKFSPNAQERKQNINRLAEEIQVRQHMFGQGKLPGQPSEAMLWNCVNRYFRTDYPPLEEHTGITLFLAHANGFPKEIWETTLRFLLSHPSASHIEEIWSWEAVQHGDSALLNANSLSGIYDWMDNSRDIANFLIKYLPEVPLDGSLSTHLPRLPRHVSEDRKKSGYSRRILVDVGHSMGGCTSVEVAINFPALFSSMILIDPVIVQPHSYARGYLRGMVIGALQRRTRWSSREEALQLFKASPFFAAWHPDVLQLYVDYGLTEDSEGGVRLKMSGLHEALVFANDRTSAEVWELLEKLDEDIELKWILPGKPESKGIQGEAASKIRVWRRPANSSNVVIHSAGHLITQESPEELAQQISDFLEHKYRNRIKSML
ncbi:Alpha/beta hydrolase family-domain-containing protein [Hygrophoropsis aurantiaca]|uniref:Alpha/beta hydrolase family-domain-containing protein n=1 Tax=Hygrophoropsis aurantiaca TaxID=72124 RepID=A0ACB8AE03_9AGAM|nr:Alpha/beta hydrolase family-domain-containing protein [Hygrophoropsis aurantiaca]